MTTSKIGPLRSCLYCDRTHISFKADYACQDHYERNYDEEEIMLCDDPRADFGVRFEIYQIMLGRINDLDIYTLGVTGSD